MKTKITTPHKLDEQNSKMQKKKSINYMGTI